MGGGSGAVRDCQLRLGVVTAGGLPGLGLLGRAAIAPAQGSLGSSLKVPVNWPGVRGRAKAAMRLTREVACAPVIRGPMGSVTQAKVEEYKGA